MKERIYYHFKRPGTRNHLVECELAIVGFELGPSNKTLTLICNKGADSYHLNCTDCQVVLTKPEGNPYQESRRRDGDAHHQCTHGDLIC